MIPVVSTKLPLQVRKQGFCCRLCLMTRFESEDGEKDRTACSKIYLLVAQTILATSGFSYKYSHSILECSVRQKVFKCKRFSLHHVRGSSTHTHEPRTPPFGSCCGQQPNKMPSSVPQISVNFRSEDA